MTEKEKNEIRRCFDTYPAPLDVVTDYTRKHSIRVDVTGHYVMRVFIKMLLFFAKTLSWKAAYRLGKGIGLLCFYLRIRRHIAMTNMDIVFKDSKTHKEKVQMYKASLINLGQVVINYLRIPYMGESFWRDHCDWQGEEILREVMNRNKGALLIAGHFGMMDLPGGKLGMSGYPVAVVGKRIKHPVINHFAIETRNTMNLGTIAHRNSMKRILEGIARGEAVAMALDQNMKSKQGVFLDWMGRKASSVRSAAYVAKKTGAPVVAGYMIQKSEDRFELVITKEVPWEPHPENLEAELLINAQHQADAVQEIILRRPELWFWIHQRWRLQPEGVENPYKQKAVNRKP
jgi:Kdo2-lipid IVA lauroyltransferase/acyltransferase